MDASEIKRQAFYAHLRGEETYDPVPEQAVFQRVLRDFLHIHSFDKGSENQGRAWRRLKDSLFFQMGLAQQVNVLEEEKKPEWVFAPLPLKDDPRYAEPFRRWLEQTALPNQGPRQLIEYLAEFPLGELSERSQIAGEMDFNIKSALKGVKRNGLDASSPFSFHSPEQGFYSLRYDHSSELRRLFARAELDLGMSPMSFRRRYGRLESAIQTHGQALREALTKSAEQEEVKYRQAGYYNALRRVLNGVEHRGEAFYISFEDWLRNFTDNTEGTRLLWILAQEPQGARLGLREVHEQHPSQFKDLDSLKRACRRLVDAGVYNEGPIRLVHESKRFYIDCEFEDEDQVLQEWLKLAHRDFRPALRHWIQVSGYPPAIQRLFSCFERHPLGTELRYNKLLQGADWSMRGIQSAMDKYRSQDRNEDPFQIEYAQEYVVGKEVTFRLVLTRS